MNIDTIEVKPSDTIVIYYNREDIDLNSFYDQFHNIKEQYPNNIVIGLPNGMDIQLVDKDQLINLRDFLTSIIEGGYDHEIMA